MSLSKLSETIRAYTPLDATEASHQQATLNLIETSGEKCLYRDHLPGHLTANAMILSPCESQVLLHQHIYLDLWCGFGGHADGEPDLIEVAKMEAREESGMTDFKIMNSNILDIDVHTIPANPKKDEGEHDHYCVTYLFKATEDFTETTGPEGAPLKWIPIDQISSYAKDPSSARIMQRLMKDVLNVA